MLHPWFSIRRISRRIASSGLILAIAFLGGTRVISATLLTDFASQPVAKTVAGSVRGTTVGRMEAFLGIPYAAPPVGALRWQPPQPPKRWAGMHNAMSFASHCPQPSSPFGFPSMSEDCLYLNVFAPRGTKAGAKLPVTVWIHGGAFVSGESDDYDADRLVAHGVIVVTLNYRLGYLGFLATTGLDAEPHTHVNYGLLDQQYALAWTKTNIAAFGGDPLKTTVFGQSAGGESVFAQLLSPGSAGLFSRAIIQSGAYGILSLPTLGTAETNGNTIVTALGCAPSDATCQRNLAVTQILAAEASETPLTGGPSPAIDGTMIPQAPQTALTLGRFNKVPIIQGSNHDEFRLFTAELFDLSGGPLIAAEYPIVVQQSLAAVGLGGDTAAVLAQYPLSKYASPDLAFSALTTDAIFSTQAFLTDSLLSAYTPLYAYEFSDEQAPEDFLPPVSFPYAAAHGSELQFLYDSYDRKAPALSPMEKNLASTMVHYWTGFAKNTVPDGFGLPLWTPFLPLADDIESLVAPTPHLFFHFVDEHKVAFWVTLFTGQSANGTRANPYLTIEDARRAAHRRRPNAMRF